MSKTFINLLRVFSLLSLQELSGWYLNSNLKIYKQAKRDGRRGEEKKEKRETQKNKERNISTYLIFHLYIRVERTQYLWTPYFAPFCLFAQKSRRKKRIECFASRKVGIGTWVFELGSQLKFHRRIRGLPYELWNSGPNLQFWKLWRQSVTFENFGINLQLIERT